MSGKVIAITGASSGIGEATARLLAADGARLVLGARRTDRLGALASQINGAGGTALAVELDVTRRDSMQGFVDAGLERFGRIDVLVNNAGIMKLAPLSELRIEDWDRMIDVNLKGVLNGVAAALPSMLAQQSGHFVLVGSTSGLRVGATGGVYAATKFALRAIAESLRIEGGSKIRSTLISPGATRTELIDAIDHPIMRQALEARKKDMLPAESIARAIAFAIAEPPEVDVSEVIVRPANIKE